MTVYNIHALLNEDRKEKINVTGTLDTLFKKIKEVYPDATEEDIFMLGYVLSNPVVKDNFMHKFITKEIPYDFRISEDYIRRGR